MTTKRFVKLTKILGNKKFFYLVIMVAVLQGLWFSFTYQPGLFDEKYHFDFMNMYTERLNPFFADQDEEWDILGAASRNVNYFFYYVFSWLLRAIKLFTDSYFVQVMGMRLIFLSFFVVGLAMYRKLFLYIKIPKYITNLSLLLFVLMPVFATFPAVINYDNLVFLLFPLIMLLLLDILKSPSVNIFKLYGLVNLSMFASLMKFSFIAVLVPVFITLLVGLWKRHGTKLFATILSSCKRVSLGLGILMISTTILLAGLIIERPVFNQIRYQRVTASCVNVLSEGRCLRNYTAARSINFRKEKPDDFVPISMPHYALKVWTPGMIDSSARVFPVPLLTHPLKALFYVLPALMVTIFMLYVRQIWKDWRYRTIVFVAVFYTVVLFLENYRAYVSLGQPVAISTRYLMPIVPILIAATMLFYAKFLRGKLKAFEFLAIVFIFSVLLTQGGSIFTHLITVDQWKWGDSGIMERLNTDLENKYEKIIIRPDE